MMLYTRAGRVRRGAHRREVLEAMRESYELELERRRRALEENGGEDEAGEAGDAGLTGGGDPDSADQVDPADADEVSLVSASGEDEGGSCSQDGDVLRRLDPHGARAGVAGAVEAESADGDRATEAALLAHMS